MPTQLSRMFEGQFLHALALTVLLGAVYLATGYSSALQGSFMGLSTTAWLILVLADAIIYQVYVWFCWRFEIYEQNLTRFFGDTERAFTVYAVGFAILFIARFFLVTALGYSNQGTWSIDPLIGYLVATVIAVPAIYLFYSVRVYFGFRRAFGIDHFVAETRSLPIVREGIFKHTSNAMYVFGIGALWIPAFAFQSIAGLIAAAFSHAYIWVHFYTVEGPDMRLLYAGSEDAD